MPAPRPAFCVEYFGGSPGRWISSGCYSSHARAKKAAKFQVKRQATRVFLGKRPRVRIVEEIIYGPHPRGVRLGRW